MTTTSHTRNCLITGYPIIAFFILAMGLGGGAVFLVVQGLLPPLAALASALSVSIAGLIMTVLEDGRNGLRLLLNRLLIWRAGIGYWIFVIFFLIVAQMLGSLFNPLFNGDLPYFGSFKPGFELLPIFIAFFFIAGLGQELGWTGYLIPKLQSRFSALTSCLIRTVLTGLWHLPLLYFNWLQHPAVADFHYAGWIDQKGFLLALSVLLIMFLLPWSIFFSWLFNNTKGSLLLVSLLHGSEVFVAYIMMSAGINPGNLNNFFGYGMIMVLSAVVIVVFTGPENLSRANRRICH